jgi:hypothetical protein
VETPIGQVSEIHRLTPAPATCAALSGNAARLCRKYEHYVTPAPATVAKVNIRFRSGPDGAPSELLGIAEVGAHVEVERYPALTDAQQQRYGLDRLHEALIRCAKHFGWHVTRIEDARGRMLGGHVVFTILWKKPVSRQDRRMTVQGARRGGGEDALRLSLSRPGRRGVKTHPAERTRDR